MPSRHRDLIVVGASAGGVEALRAMVAGMPADLPAAVAIVLHMPAGGTSALPQILSRIGPLPAVTAKSGMPIHPGTIYTASPDHHLLVLDDEFVLTRGPTENGYRPAVNALFRSAAVAAGARVTGVLLSGVLDDGVAGLVAVRGRGGAVIVQDPADALYPGMPRNALRHLSADHVVPAAEMGALLARVARETVDADGNPPARPLLTLENRIAHDRRIAPENENGTIGTVTGLSCPDCQGVLNEVEPDSQRYRCRVGHGCSAEALVQAQGDAFERALWTALRTLEEKVSLSARMQSEAHNRGHQRRAERYDRIAQESAQAADVLRGYLTAVPSEWPSELRPVGEAE